MGEKNDLRECLLDIADTLEMLREQVLTMAGCFELDEDEEDDIE